ncbi:MAG: hypothetical protein ABSH48_00810 [Verrucomicrobiota bacterium]
MKPSILVLATLLAGASLRAPTQTAVPATVSFSATNAGLSLNPAFCGLSYEKAQLTGHQIRRTYFIGWCCPPDGAPELILAGDLRD